MVVCTRRACRGQEAPERYKMLGRLGLRYRELALGTTTFGEDCGWCSSEDESRRVFERYAGAGGNFIDTADLYQASARPASGLGQSSKESGGWRGGSK